MNLAEKLRLEQSLLESACDISPQNVIGVDEVGRGPLAGPVCAAAVAFLPAATDLLPGEFHSLLKDSKKLSPLRRERLAVALSPCCRIGIGEASVDEIDRINILQASLTAMARAVENLLNQHPLPEATALIDGNRVPKIDLPAVPIVKGDQKCVSIAAASIIAKVHRDRLMTAIAKHYTGYGWEHNFGYGTAHHLNALDRLGVTPHHRRSFAPVARIARREISE